MKYADFAVEETAKEKAPAHPEKVAEAFESTTVNIDDTSSELEIHMNDTTARPGGQSCVSADLLPLVHQLCDFMQMLRAWWEHFEDAIKKVDRAAAIKAYDLMIEGVITARQIARALGLELPPVDTLNWTVAPRQHRPAAEL